MNSQKHSFDDFFEVVLADTPESKKIHFNLRYQVYCDELGYEDKDKFPEQLEYDKWDQNADHFLVRHRFSGQWLGGLRLVRQDNDLFPFQERTSDQCLTMADDYSCGIELSRLCVLKEARHHASLKYMVEVGNAQGTDTGNVRHFHTYKTLNRALMWGLIRASAVHSAKSGVDHWYMLVAPSLAYAVSKEGFEIHQVAEPCEHRGQRTPYLLDVQKVLQNSLWEKDYKKEFVRFSELTDVTERDRLFA